MSHHARRFACGALAATVVVPPAPVLAQEPGGGLTEIVVTARRIEERLQETPVAVSAFTADTLEVLSVANVGDIAGTAPNLFKTSGPTGGSDGFFYIRGVGQFDLNPAVDPGVGTYMDGVYLGRIMGSSFDSLDIERIEVIRGPQGTLFGRNTMGGAINVVTADPGDTFGMRAKVTGGSRDRIDAQVSANLPVNDQFKLKVSGLTRNQDGWGHRDSDDETFSDVETLAGRIKALWTPTENLTVRVSADGSDGDGSPAHTVLVGYQAPPPNPAAPPGTPPTTPLGVPFPLVPGTFEAFIPSQNAGVDMFDNNSSAPADSNLDVWGVNGTIDWDFAENLRVKSITSYRELEELHHNDFDGTPFHFFNGAFITDQEQFSQELQLAGTLFDDRVDFLLGGFYFNEDVFHGNQICLGTNNGLPFFLPGFALVPNDGRCLQNNQNFDLEVDAWAFFTHVSFHVTEKLTLIAGFRYTDEEKKYRFNSFVDNTDGVFSVLQFVPPPIGPLFPPGSITPTLSPDNPVLALTGVSPNAKLADDDITPKFGVEYQFNDDLLLYYSYAEGFKSGGYNGRPSPNINTGLFDALVPFEPEEIATHEVGLKSEWFERRLRLNVAGFFSTYENIQLLVVDPVSGFFNQINAAKADIDGFEIELQALPLDGLDVMASLGYTDAEYTKLDPLLAFSGITEDDPLVNTPDWTAAVGVQYSWPIGSWGTLSIRGDFNYTDEVCFQAACATFDIQDGVGLVNMRGSWRSPDERLNVAVFGLNVTDEEYYSNTQDVIGQGLGVAFAQVARPAEWGIEVSYRYGY